MAESMSLSKAVYASIVTVIVSLPAAVLADTFAGGTGEPNDPYQIATARQLLAIGSDTKLLDKCYILVADVDLDPNLPEGQVFSQSPLAQSGIGHGGVYGRFEGTFDGDGHVIRNLVIHTRSEKMAGLFGRIAPSGHIRNLGVEGVEIRRSLDTGSEFAGGAMAGINEAGAITGCYARGAVSGPHRSGLPGHSTDDRIGGLVGENLGVVSACYAIVDVNGAAALGGLIGRSEGLVLCSFSAGSVAGSGRAGGLIGVSETGTAMHSYWDMETSGMSVSAAGEGRTTAAMMSRQGYESWTRSGLWTLDDARGYPRLAWEQAPGTVIGEFRYDAGRGTTEDPFQIRTAEQFMAIGYHPDDFDREFVLTADIDFNGIDCNEMLPIGCEYRAFSGRFDGRARALSNLRMERPGKTAVGVFGVVGVADVFPRGEEFHYGFNDDGQPHWSYGSSGGGGSTRAPQGTVKDLQLRDVTIVGEEYVGGLIGFAYGTVTDCSVSGQVTGRQTVGGLVGRSLAGTISGCRIDAQVTGEFAVGGLVGSTYKRGGLNLQDCHAQGSVMGQLNTGGLIGLSQGDVISRCTAQCEVRGGWMAGGCLGYAVDATVTTSYALGTVTAERHVGGFVGEAMSGAISDSFCQSEVTGEQCVGGFVGVYGPQDIVRCYAAASVTASNPAVIYPSVGGFAGSFGPYAEPWDESTSKYPVGISNCFWDDDLCSGTQGVGNRRTSPTDAQGLPTAQMQAAATFTDAGWDFLDTWMICEAKDYPRLKWENTGCPQ